MQETVKVALLKIEEMLIEKPGSHSTMAAFYRMKSHQAVVEKVAVIGGGIGGLATAIALLNQGMDVQVYEQAKELRPVGAGLTILPNGLKALESIQPGLANLLKQAGSQIQKFNLRKKTGEIVLSYAIVLEEKYEQPQLNIRWSRLQEILASALPPGILHPHHRCMGLEQNQDNITAYFAGGETVQADLLVGADGLNSVVRQALLCDGTPRYSGRMSWRSVIPYSHQLLYPQEDTLFTDSTGKNMLLCDVGNGEIFWSAGSLFDESTLSGTATEAKARVLKEFASWAEPVEAIIAATDASSIVERPIYDRPPVPSWSQGRVTLMGDAAHPMVPALGQGANTAFEDAWELAQCLCHAPTLEAALTHYENSRIARTQVIHARSALRGFRAYEADSETYLCQVVELSKMNNDEFEQWLYSYKPREQE